ncbi:MAG: hypothetical protein RH948_08875 [Cyclobacteriaceae bacterium]
MPTLSSSTLQSLVPAVAKSFHANANGKKKKKYDRTTMAIRNAGFGAKLRVNEL